MIKKRCLESTKEEMNKKNKTYSKAIWTRYDHLNVLSSFLPINDLCSIVIDYYYQHSLLMIGGYRWSGNKGENVALFDGQTIERIGNFSYHDFVDDETFKKEIIIDERYNSSLIYDGCNTILMIGGQKLAKEFKVMQFNLITRKWTSVDNLYPNLSQLLSFCDVFLPHPKKNNFGFVFSYNEGIFWYDMKRDECKKICDLNYRLHHQGESIIFHENCLWQLMVDERDHGIVRGFIQYELNETNRNCSILQKVVKERPHPSQIIPYSSGGIHRLYFYVKVLDLNSFLILDTKLSKILKYEIKENQWTDWFQFHPFNEMNYFGCFHVDLRNERFYLIDINHQIHIYSTKNKQKIIVVKPDYNCSLAFFSCIEI